MPTQKYALVRGEEKKLTISWGVGWSNVRVEYDGEEIGMVETRKELQAGQTFTLPDQSELNVKLQSSIFSSGLSLTRNGVPVPDSAKDPISTIRGCWQIAHIVAAYNILIGILFVVLKFDTPYLPKFGYITAALGVGYLILAQMLKRRKSLPALIGFIILFTLETLLEAATNYSFFVLFRAAIIYYLFLGIGSIKKFKAEEPQQIPMISE